MVGTLPAKRICGGRREEAVTNEGGDPVKSPEADGKTEEIKEQMIKAKK